MRIFRDGSRLAVSVRGMNVILSPAEQTRLLAHLIDSVDEHARTRENRQARRNRGRWGRNAVAKAAAKASEKTLSAAARVCSPVVDEDLLPDLGLLLGCDEDEEEYREHPLPWYAPNED